LFKKHHIFLIYSIYSISYDPVLCFNFGPANKLYFLYITQLCFYILSLTKFLMYYTKGYILFILQIASQIKFNLARAVAVAVNFRHI